MSWTIWLHEAGAAALMKSGQIAGGEQSLGCHGKEAGRELGYPARQLATYGSANVNVNSST